MADAQPRKRKDKRRKKGRFKDDSITGENDPRSPATVMPQKSSGDDTNIHVYHDAHTGGGWCAKIVFFILLAIIGVLIGVILLEYRGSTDLDAPVQDSKYAEIFEGWIDDTPQLHDDEDEHPIDDHDDEHDDDHDDDGHEDEGGSDEHGDDEENGSEEGEQEEADEEEQSEISNEVEDEEGADDEGDNEPEDEPQADEPDEEEQEDSTELGNDEEGEENADDDENNSEANNDDGDDDGDDLSAEDIQKVLDSLEEDDALEEIDEATENSNENEVVDNNPEEAELLRQQEEAEAENEEESSSVAVKFGVGVALLVVAHLVLVRKWNNASNAEVSSDSSVTMSPPQTVTDTSEGDLSRRNTIVSEDTVKSLHEAMERARNESQDMTDEEELEDEEEEEEEEEEEIEVDSYPKYSSSYRSEPEKLEVPSVKTQGGFDLSYNRPSPIRSSTPPGLFDDDDEAEEEEEVEEDDDDEELLKKLEAKYGKLPSKQIEVSDNPEDEEEAEEDEEEEEEEDEDEAFPSWRRVKSVPEKKPEATDDTPKVSKTGGAKAFEDELLDEDQFFKEHASYDNNLERTVEKFRMEVRKNGTSTKALYGLAIALDRLAEKLRSNKLLVESIQAYENLLSYGINIPDALYKKVADRCINRMRFKGENSRAITIHKALIEKFPTDVNFRNNLTITYLIIDKIEAARRNVLDTLKKWPKNGLAKTLYGFILKTSDNNIEESVKYLKEGVESKEPGVLDGRFFFHLGDALLRLGRSSEAMEVYETGVKEGFFLSKYQRSLYNVNRLTGRPWWTKEQTTYKKFFDLLEENWMNIRKEGLSLLNSKGLFKDEAENLIDVGDWKQFELFSRGRKIPNNCKQAPYTCSLVEFFTPASHCRRGQIKFSVMHPDTHVWPHCGPTNCRLRAHLGLKIPANTFIRVAESTRTWAEGKIIIFDDSFEHEVWHNGTDTRLILIVDVWHPELTANEKQTLPAI